MTIGSAGMVLQCQSETNADGQTQQTTTVLFQTKAPVKATEGGETAIVVVTPTWTPTPGAAILFDHKADGDAGDQHCWIAEMTTRPVGFVGWREYARNADGRWREMWNEQAPG